mgnify:CR=1 FL=1
MEKINFEDLPSTKTPIDSKNLNLLQTNVENAINGVIENGEGYIKFGDGTQICYGNIAFDIGTMTQQSSFWRYDNANLSISFPTSFVSKPLIVATVVAGNYGSLLYVINCTNEKITQLNVLTLTNASNQRTNINYIAIGKWK